MTKAEELEKELCRLILQATPDIRLRNDIFLKLVEYQRELRAEKEPTHD